MGAQECAAGATTPIRQKTRYRRSRKKIVKSGRTCLACGKDPAPNYFYCPSCHHKVSGGADGDSA